MRKAKWSKVDTPKKATSEKKIPSSKTQRGKRGNSGGSRLLKRGSNTRKGPGECSRGCGGEKTQVLDGEGRQKWSITSPAKKTGRRQRGNHARVKTSLGNTANRRVHTHVPGTHTHKTTRATSVSANPNRTLKQKPKGRTRRNATAKRRPAVNKVRQSSGNNEKKEWETKQRDKKRGGLMGFRREKERSSRGGA